jgi:HD-GYP domain-containing protein (c-di-GMP phosphodiesterase class II)
VARDMRVRFPFRLKILLPFFGLGLGLVIGGAIIVSQIIFESVSERFTNQLIESGKLAAEWMVQEEDALLTSLRYLSFTSGVPEALRARDAERLRELTYSIAINQQAAAVEFLDNQGTLILGMRHQVNAGRESYAFVRAGSPVFADAAFVKQVLAGAQDGRGDKFSGLIERDQQTFFYVAGPVFDEQGQQMGVVLVGQPLSVLVEHMRAQTLAQVTLYHSNGVPAASSFPLPETLDPGSAARVLEQQASTSFRRSHEILLRRPVDVLSTEYDELLGPWKARGADLGVIGVALYKNLLVNPSLPTRVQIVSLLVLAGLFTVLAGLYVSNYVTSPLASLTRASRQISRGNLRVRVPSPKSNDELSDLAWTFNKMVVSLNQANRDIVNAYDSTLEGWALALELRERETAEHGRRVTERGLMLARIMGIKGEALIHFRRGAMLHDIGKMGVPDHILLKPGSYTPEEFAIMKMHPVYAWEFLSKIEYLRPALEIPYCHHEKWDGSGYPRGLHGEDIPQSARIFAVVDVWDAVTHDRVYRKAMTRDVAVRLISNGRGKHFDPRVVDVFLQILPDLDPIEAVPAAPNWLAMSGQGEASDAAG